MKPVAGVPPVTISSRPPALAGIKDIKLEKKAEGDGENASMNTFNSSQKNSANIVWQQLLLNMIKYAAIISKD